MISSLDNWLNIIAVLATQSGKTTMLSDRPEGHCRTQDQVGYAGDSDGSRGQTGVEDQMLVMKSIVVYPRDPS